MNLYSGPLKTISTGKQLLQLNLEEHGWGHWGGPFKKRLPFKKQNVSNGMGTGYLKSVLIVLFAHFTTSQRVSQNIELKDY